MNKNIKLQSLVLADFKRHEHLEVEFAPTVTAIRGDNYSGKSSLTHAIFFALFGATAVPGGKSVVVRKGAKGCRVALTMGAEQGPTVVITRTDKTATVHLNGDLVASGHTSVNTWVEEFFGLDQSTFVRLTNSAQGDTPALLTLGVTALNRLIEELAEADYVDTLATKAWAVHQTASARLANMPEPVDLTEYEELHKQQYLRMEGYTEQARLLKGQLRELSEVIAHKRTALNAAIQANKEAQAVRTQVAQLSGQLEAFKTQLEARNESLKSFEGFVDNSVAYRQEIEVAQGKLHAIQTDQEKRTRLETRIADLQKNVARIQVEADKHTAAFAPHSALVPKVEAARVLCTNLYAECVRARKDYEEALKAVNEGSCPACNRAYDEACANEAETLLESREKVSAELEVKYKASLESHAQLKKQLEGFAKDLAPDSLAICQEKKKSLAEVAAELSGLPAVAADQAPQLKQRIAELKEKAMEDSAKASRKAMVEHSISVLAISIHQTEEKIEKLPVVAETDVTESLKEIGELDERNSQLVTKQHEALRLEQSESAACTSTAVLIRAEKDNAEKRKELEGTSGRYKKFNSWLKDNKATFMRDTWDELCTLISEFARNCTDGAIELVRRTDDGEFVYVERGLELPVAGAASGGQRAIMGVALRVALPSLLPVQVPFLVLDEPSSELNDHHAAALASSLYAQDRQIIMVTHRDGDEFACDAVIQL